MALWQPWLRLPWKYTVIVQGHLGPLASLGLGLEKQGDAEPKRPSQRQGARLKFLELPFNLGGDMGGWMVKHPRASVSPLVRWGQRLFNLRAVVEMKGLTNHIQMSSLLFLATHSFLL